MLLREKERHYDQLKFASNSNNINPIIYNIILAVATALLVVVVAAAVVVSVIIYCRVG